MSNIEKLAQLFRSFKGTSKSAARRAAESSRGVLHQAEEVVIQHNGKPRLVVVPDQIIEMSDRRYTVARDGSFRRIKETHVQA